MGLFDCCAVAVTIASRVTAGAASVDATGSEVVIASVIGRGSVIGSGLAVGTRFVGRRSRLSGQLVLRKDGCVLPLLDTRVTFPSGGLTAAAEVLAVVDLTESGRTGVVTDVSPFHPVDQAWPDQGPDVGTIAFGDGEAEVVDTVLGATSGANLLSAPNIPVRRGEPGWAFVVIHVVPSDGRLPVVGQQVELRVEPAQRVAVSIGHTACHLAALALNAALADRWRKPIQSDGLGHPNFDSAALVASAIRPFGAVDTYRIGKSLRKRGFDVAGLHLDQVTETANRKLADWVAAGVSIAIESDGPGLTDRRSWVCRLPDGVERIPCGGTHPTSLAGVTAIDVRLQLADAELIMETKVTPG